MDHNKYVIRPAVVKDLDQLFKMLVDLVKYEGLYENFKLTRERLENELFGAQADWNCLVVATLQEELIGFCLYSFTNTDRAFNLTPSIHIDDLYVSPNYRNKKIGQKLLSQLALIAENHHISRFNLLCVKDNKIGQNFYQKIGGDRLELLDYYKIHVDKLINS